MPWQQLVFDVGYEQNADGSLHYDLVVVLVSRQSGKTILVMGSTLHRLVDMVETHGPQRSTYVAQKRLSGRAKFERDFAPILRRSDDFREVEHARQRPRGDTGWRLSLNNGSEAFEFGSQSYWQLGVPDDSGGHGDTLNHFTIDEARFQENANLEEALDPSTATSRDAQGWVTSTSGTAGSNGTANSAYLWRKVLAGRAACRSGDHGRMAYFEWSAPEEADSEDAWGDPEVWRSCMPALGITISEEFIASRWEKALRGGQDGIDNFRRAYLNQWPEIPVLPEDAHETEHVLGREAWEACADVASAPSDPVCLALDVSLDRGHAAFGAAGACDAGTHVEVVDYRRGTDWVVARAVELHARWGGALSVAAKSPAAALVPDLVQAGVEVVEVSVEDHSLACAHLVDEVAGGRVRHLDDVTLTGAVKAAEKRWYGNESFLWSRKNSAGDICPLVAVTLAAWATTQAAADVGFVDIDDLLKEDA